MELVFMTDAALILIAVAVGTLIVILLIILIFHMLKNKSGKKKNKNIPVRTDKAFLVERSSLESRRINEDNTITIASEYHLVYKIKGERLDFSVPKKIYIQIPDDVKGILTYKGDNFIRFEYSGGIVER
ncbi:MAG TPA: hypothetical protein DIW26_09100 [Ruminococcus sp.]|nr:hypothetical protein [Ruminococcus sp.]HCR74493.1 hypothetical protein [Ruminococcus sp.]